MNLSQTKQKKNKKTAWSKYGGNFTSVQALKAVATMCCFRVAQESTHIPSAFSAQTRGKIPRILGDGN